MITALFFLAASSPTPGTDVLAHIHAGNVLCTNPDSATKTCSTIDVFEPGENGSFLDKGEVLISPDQPITLETSSVIKVDGAMFCGVMELKDLQHGIVRVQGAPLPPDRNEAVLTKITDRLKPLVGRKICEGLRIQDGQLMRYGQAERVDLPLPPKAVSWISSAEGYRVAPR